MTSKKYILVMAALFFGIFGFTSGVQAAPQKVAFTAEYPVFTSQPINEVINREVETFRRHFSELVPTKSLGLTAHAMSVSAVVAGETPQWISLKWKMSVKFVDEKQAYLSETGTVIDLKTFQKKPLNAYFKSTFPYLNVVSEQSFQRLKKILPAKADQDWLKRGLAPLEENFKDFYQTKDGLVVIFKPGQVAPTSAGSLSVTIPFADIKLFLKD
jgi:hypothetical protein